ncbi:Paraxanthine methyltransferase [Thalictrum thalictroides]|uniref:Paraxanthine methyltransferase n=1 Tax=Thalictrum thalictroides TaxID=46969 RepID=A0A7J6VWS4_THATH|nr:Paraxanthine methyltransferase [Thalictrum thalictroides]
MTQDKSTSATAFSMNGGDGPYSYAENSSYQRKAIEATQGMISEEKFDVKQMCSSSSPMTFCIADLGCSVGPNTFIAMQNIIDGMKEKNKSQGHSSQIPEFQVFFNDQVLNDFNKLLMSLPLHREYFASAVPGSFYDRLFPKASLHFVYSSSSIHWLSMVPKPVEDMNSPAFNKGRIHYGGAAKEVVDAYLAQFVSDMECFLSARAEELVSRGLMGLLVPTRKKANLILSTVLSHHPFDVLGSCLMDMATKGLLEEEKVDSFNLPLYIPTVEEFEEAMKSNEHFSIERFELLGLKSSSEIVPETLSMHARASMEGRIGEHFGIEILDELFDLFTKKAAELGICNSGNRFDAELFVLLKRK